MAWKRIVEGKFVCEQTVYVYKKDDQGAWNFSRELESGQRFDLDKATVRPKTERDFDYCRNS